MYSSSGRSGSHNEAAVQGPGVITGRYGTIGEVLHTEDDYWPLNTTLYVSDFKGKEIECLNQINGHLYSPSIVLAA